MNQDGSASFRRLPYIFQEMTQLAESRPAGSPGEEKLKQYIEECLRNSGYTLSRQSFRFPQIPHLYNEQFIDAIFVIAGILLIQTAPEYHTVEDIPDRINFELLSKAYIVLTGTINNIDTQQNG
jgi:hypothetical protein